jgi:hypothetical protein
MPDLALNDFKVFDPVKSTSKINASNVMMMWNWRCTSGCKHWAPNSSLLESSR